MENEVMFNPLSYDEQIVAEKIGAYEYAPQFISNDMNTSIRMAMLEEELANSKRQIKQLKNDKAPQRETFAGKESPLNLSKIFNQEAPVKHVVTGNQESNSLSDIFTDKRFLILIVFMLIAFCIMQYFTYKNEMKDMFEMVYTLLQKQPTSAVPLVQPVQSV